MISLLRWLRPKLIFPFPSGITPDKSANFGLFGLISAVNNYSEAVTAIVTAGTNTTLTAAQALIGVTRLTAGASGGFTITLPSTVLLIAALGPAIPFDGTYAEPVSFMNDNVGQIGTLTVGDASTTINGTATIATNTRRLFMMTVTSPTTVTFQNIGSIAL